MDSRTFKISGENVTVTNPRIIEIIKKAESLESLGKFNEAHQELEEYLLGENCQNYLTVSQFGSNMSLYEAIVQGFEPLIRKYHQKFGLNVKVRELKFEEKCGSEVMGLDRFIKPK